MLGYFSLLLNCHPGLQVDEFLLRPAGAARERRLQDIPPRALQEGAGHAQVGVQAAPRPVQPQEEEAGGGQAGRRRQAGVVAVAAHARQQSEEEAGQLRQFPIGT